MSTVAATPPAPSGSLRQLVVRGGAYLAGRELVGMLIRLGGMVLTLREVGPTDFGLYSSAAAYVAFATVIAQMGTEIYLIRMPETPTRRHYDEAFTHLLISSLVVTAASLALSIPLANVVKPTGTLIPLRIMLLAIPLNVLWAPGQALIERNFAYRRMGMLELGGDFVLYAVSVVMAFMGYGAWALVAGYFAWQAWLLVGSILLSGLRYRLAWSREGSGKMLRHGFSYSLTTTTNSLQMLVVPVVVGALSGATGVGYVAFAQRMTSTLAFAQRSLQRVGIVAISRARNKSSRELGDAMVEGIVLLMVGMTIPFALFGLTAHWIVPFVFGPEWSAALPLYVLLAIYTVVNVFNTVRYTLFFALDQNMKVVCSKVIQLVVIAGLSYPLVKQYGSVGLGAASLIALVSTLYTEWAARDIAPICYRKLALPMIGLLPPLLAPLFPFPLSLLTLAGLGIVLLLPSVRRDLAQIRHTVQSTLKRGTTIPEPAQATADAASGGAAPNALPLPMISTLPEAEPVGPVHGLPAAGSGALSTEDLNVILARIGWMLGRARRSRWPVMVVVFESDPDCSSPEGSGLNTAHAIAVRLSSELRFDDIVTALGAFTVVAAVPIVPGGSDAAVTAARLASVVSDAVGAENFRSSHAVVAPQSNEEADQLLRRAVLGL